MNLSCIRGKLYVDKWFAIKKNVRLYELKLHKQSINKQKCKLSDFTNLMVKLRNIITVKTHVSIKTTVTSLISCSFSYCFESRI